MIYLKENQCMGCNACFNICPVDAIYMQYNSEGFQYVKVDEKLCIKCKKCIDVCPVLNESKYSDREYSDREAYAAWSLNKENRFKSTSGGAFTEIARKILESGGVVFGAAYQENFRVAHQKAESEESLALLRQSKYVQSEIGSTFKEVEEALESGTRVLYAGTPCQIAGLKHFLGDKMNHLLTVDFICRGVNSYFAFHEYLVELEAEYESAVDSVWFKHKKDGWNRFGTMIRFKNSENYFGNRYEDDFMRGYLKYNLMMRPACHQCRFLAEHSIADMTLADFWGVQKIRDYEDMEQGISLMLINTDKGRDMVISLSSDMYLEEVNLKEALQGNGCISHSVPEGKYRDYFFSRMKKDKFSEIIKEIERMEKNADGQ